MLAYVLARVRLRDRQCQASVCPRQRDLYEADISLTTVTLTGSILVPHLTQAELDGTGDDAIRRRQEGQRIYDEARSRGECPKLNRIALTNNAFVLRICRIPDHEEPSRRAPRAHSKQRIYQTLLI